MEMLTLILQTMDLHDPQYQGFFVSHKLEISDVFADPCYQDIPVDNLYATVR